MKQNQFKKTLLLMTMFIGAHASWAAGPNPYVGTNASTKTSIPTASAIDMETGTYYDYNTGRSEHPVASGHTDWCEANAYVIFNLTNSTSQRYSISFEAATNNDGAQVQLEVYSSGNEASPESGTKVVSITKAGWNTFNSYNVVTDALPTGDLTFKLKFLTKGSNVQNIQFTAYAGTTYTLTVETVGSGTVTPGTNDYEAKSVQTLTATPEWGWDFTKWTDGSDNDLSTSNPYDVTVDANKTVKAVFTQRATTLNIPSNEALDIAVATTNKGTFKIVDGKTTFDSFNPDGTATLTLNVTEAGAFNFAFKACTANDGNSIKFDIVDNTSSETEVSKEIAITNNGSWTDFQDYSFDGILTAGLKTMTITFLHEGYYTSNAEEFIFTLKAATTLNESSDYTPVAGPANVTLTRSITANKWSTIVLPFAVANVESVFGTGTQVAQLNNVNGNTLSFQSVTSMNANEPYMIKTAANFATANISGVSIVEGTPAKTVSGVTFQGVYAAGNIPAGAYFVSGNQLYRASDATNTIKPFHAYFTTSNNAPELNFVIDGGTTGISTMHNSQSIMHNEYYNLAGQRVSQPTKGLYIVNGKKMIVK